MIVTPSTAARCRTATFGRRDPEAASDREILAFGKSVDMWIRRCTTARHGRAPARASAPNARSVRTWTSTSPSTGVALTGLSHDADGPGSAGERSCGRRPPETELPGASSAAAAAGGRGKPRRPGPASARRHSGARLGASDLQGPEVRFFPWGANRRPGGIGRVWRRADRRPPRPPGQDRGQVAHRHAGDSSSAVSLRVRPGEARAEGSGKEDPPVGRSFQRSAQVAGSRSASCCVLRALQATRSRPSRLAR
jgi:hypothetical protein